MARDVFLSHSSADKATAQAVLEGFEGRGTRRLGRAHDHSISDRGRDADRRHGMRPGQYTLAGRDFDALRSHPRYQKVLELIG
jgi:hypothetical protein